MGLPQGILSAVGGAVSGIGTALHLPEFGISEAIIDPNRSVFTASPSNLSKFTPPPVDPNAAPATPGMSATSATAADPYAAFGGTARYQQLVNDFGTQKNNIFGTASDAATNAGLGLRGSILDLVDQLRSGQQGIDSKANQNELAKIQGSRSILDMIGSGIRSGGVMLANKNAGSSSATEALARAYGQLGRGEMTKVGNQYELGQNDINLMQDQLGASKASGMRKISDSKEMAVNSIVADARDRLARLDAAMASANLPDRIAIEQEKESIRQSALGQLSQYDQMLQDETNGVTATSADARHNEGLRLANAGTAPDSAFQYSTDVPAQFQNTGPFASELPIFTFNKNRRLA